MNKIRSEADDVLIHHGHRWFFEKADLEQGAWYLADPDGKKFAVILPHDRNLPIEKSANAALYVRDHGSDQWHHRETRPFDEALTSGCAHADRYRERYEAAHIIERIRAAKKPDAQQPVRSDAVARAIAKVKQKEDEERQAADRGHSREQGKE